MNVCRICDPQSLILIHVCIMHISVMRVKFCQGPTDRQADSKSWIGKNMFHLVIVFNHIAFSHKIMIAWHVVVIKNVNSFQFG